ncbi:MAG: hypothetical protein AAGE89_00055 [Pseudomonadota bacterium]
MARKSIDEAISSGSRMNWQWNRGLAARWLLAGPATIVLALLTMAAMPLTLPQGSAGIDHIVFPLLLFPALWAAFFFYAILTENLLRAGLVFILILLVEAAVVGSALI